ARPMAERNPYEVLGVSRQASDGEIKRAFRKLARQYHPDRNQGDAGAEAKFKEVQAAYDAIGTSEARREFDQQEQMRNMFGGGRGRGGPSMNFGGMGGGFEDILGQMFGGGGGMGGMPRQTPRSAPRQQPKAATINVGLDITMEQAAEGGEFTFSYKRFKRQGTSMETKRTTLKLRLDAGVTHGTTRTLKGQGHDHPEGERGDVVVTVRIDAGEAYRWEGDQLVQEVPVPYSVMMLGGKVSVKLLSGKTGKLSVDPMTQVGDRRRMAKAGYNGGDLTLEFVLAEPETLTDAQRQALEDLGSAGL
ncbi:MAG: DnaJ domain-containing protein, partial [Candidatus Thermoplasmatota archaeon]|nr:DnaJ domain-containing protein [Candidatus Thermoplasmatota archaeon]